MSENSPQRSDKKKSIPELGLGAAQLGNLGRAITDEQGAALVEDAWKQGYRYFDTAPHYGLGLSEQRLGAALGKYDRSDYFISTKVGRLLVENDDNSLTADDQGFAVSSSKKRVWDFSRDGILRSVEASLSRLDMDSVDLLLLHDPDDHFEQASTEGIAALIELREQGVVTYVGAGMNFSKPLAELISRADINFVMCAGRLTLLDNEAEREVVPVALERGVGIIAAGVYNSGILGKRWPDQKSSFHYGAAPEDVLSRARQIAKVCERFGVELPDAAVAFVKQNPAVASVVLGARDGTQSLENFNRHAKEVDPKLWGDLKLAGLIS